MAIGKGHCKTSICRIKLSTYALQTYKMRLECSHMFLSATITKCAKPFGVCNNMKTGLSKWCLTKLFRNMPSTACLLDTYESQKSRSRLPWIKSGLLFCFRVLSSVLNKSQLFDQCTWKHDTLLVKSEETGCCHFRRFQDLFKNWCLICQFLEYSTTEGLQLNHRPFIFLDLISLEI